MSNINPDPTPAAGATGRGAAPHQPADDKEEIYYDGSPQLRGELSALFGWALLGIVLIGVAVAAWVLDWWALWWVNLILILIGLLVLMVPVIQAKTTRYRISNYRIDFERGVFSKKIDTLELWHVDDISFRQSLLDRILGVGTITVISGDDTTPNLRLHGLPAPRPLFDALKQRVIAVKRQRGVVKMDLG